MCVQSVSAEEQDDSALEGSVGGDVESTSQIFSCLVEVEYHVPQARSVNVRPHLVIQRTFFVTEVNASLEQIPDREQTGDIEVVGMLKRVNVLR